MYRLIEDALLQWKQQVNRSPLLLRGARQVGKSYAVRALGNTQFSNNFVEINFEFQPEFKECFKTLDPVKIVHTLSLITGQDITPGKTLLFLDEIQDCPAAINSLRYFREKMPELHVIGAGSLLEFVLNDEHFRMPVGRVQFIYLKPLSFKEYLLATQKQSLKEFIENIDFNEKIPDAIHQNLLQLTREYMVLGGMPAVLQEYLTNKNYYQCQLIQSNLLNTYRLDFGKYASHTQHKYLQKMFEKAPGLITQDFKYSKVDNGMRSRDLKTALEKLEQAGLIYLLHATSAANLPLNALINEKKFKLLFLDIGLINRATNLGADVLLRDDIFLVNRGAFAEQLVGQEILAGYSCFEKVELFYWAREEKSSQAQIDYILQVNDKIIPIEVKAGTTGQLKSLHIFLQEKKAPFGIQVSQKPLQKNGNILSIPIYLAGEIRRLTKLIA